MALARRSTRNVSGTIWPGFVDAMTALLLVLMFVLTIFMVVQYVLREQISGQATELDALSLQVSDLADALGLERQRTADLRDEVGSLSATLTGLRAENDAQVARIAELCRGRAIGRRYRGPRSGPRHSDRRERGAAIGPRPRARRG